MDTIGTIIWQIISERYIFVNGNLFSNCTNDIPVVDILSNGNIYGTIVNVFIEKIHSTSWWLQYSTYFIYHLNTNTQQNNNCKINLKCFVLIMNLKSFPFYPVAVGKSIIANLARLEHRDLLQDTNFLVLSVYCPLKNHM